MAAHTWSCVVCERVEVVPAPAPGDYFALASPRCPSGWIPHFFWNRFNGTGIVRAVTLYVCSDACALREPAGLAARELARLEEKP